MAQPPLPQFSTSGANVVAPTSGLKATGWIAGSRPPSQIFNWIHKLTYDWLNYLAGIIPDGPVPLKSDTDAALAASFVQRELRSIMNPMIASTGSNAFRDFCTDGAGWLLAVGQSQALKYSNDLGRTWSTGTADNSFAGDFYGCAFGNGLFVAVGANGTHGVIQTSANGATWTERANDASYRIASVAWNGTTFVALADNGSGSYKTYTSTNGTSWTAHAIGAAHDSFDLAFGAGVFVTTNNAHAPRYSADGVTWTTGAFGSSSTLVPTAIRYSAAQGFVAYGVNGSSHRELQTSPDGVTWIQVRLDAGTGTTGGLLVGDYCVIAVGATTPIAGSRAGDLDWVSTFGVSTAATNTKVAGATGGDSYSSGRVLKMYPHVALAIGANSAAGSYSVSSSWAC